MNLFNYSRRPSSTVQIGGTPLGGNYPIRIQSMTNTSTMDTEACIAQAKRIVDAGGEYVRLTTQGVREAENLKEINIGLRTDGYMVPLIADVHFNPKVAEVAALYAEKVRINPGNYENDPAKIRERFMAFLNLCKENHTAIRIGVNHGSLSERIMTEYGDTPEGMVESCMEFLRICVEEHFTDVVVSIKASNTVVMVKTVRLLAEVMDREGMAFPLHLGVTEAGDGEDGRIKSALGIGALLADGLGDTIRVSLSEDPEREIPVAKKLVDYIVRREKGSYNFGVECSSFNYLSPERRKTRAVGNIGGGNVPVVVSPRLDGNSQIDPRFKPDYIYAGRALPEVMDKDIQYIVDADVWKGVPGSYPVFSFSHLEGLESNPSPLKFIFMPYAVLSEDHTNILKKHPELVLLSQSNHPNRLGEHRALLHHLMNEGLENPVIIFQHYAEEETEDFQIKSAADMGALIIDGFCDGICLFNQGALSPEAIDATMFGILQAGRVRTSKTEYISCPGCGRTLFDLQDAIARVKAATSHLKGLKIAIMGCIVNGPGEMADADYGYVGAGRGKVSLYKGKECVEKNIPEEEAVERLMGLIEGNEDL